MTHEWTCGEYELLQIVLSSDYRGVWVEPDHGVYWTAPIDGVGLARVTMTYRTSEWVGDPGRVTHTEEPYPAPVALDLREWPWVHNDCSNFVGMYRVGVDPESIYTGELAGLTRQDDFNSSDTAASDDKQPSRTDR